MPEITKFTGRLGEIRTIMIGNEPWFVAKDIAEILGYSETSKMNRRLDDDEQTIRPFRASGSSMQTNMTIINESGLYNAIFGSKKPEAKEFRKWITGEVLPQIRKTGSYFVPTKKEDPIIDPDKMLPTTKAKIIFKDLLDVANLLRVPKHLGEVEAVKQTRMMTDIDFGGFLLAAPSQNLIENKEKALEPADLGTVLGIVGSNRKRGMAINSFLLHIGFQTKKDGLWAPTKKGSPFASSHQWVMGNKNGYNWKWNVEKIKELWTAPSE